jgi:hypothetical protein
VGATGRATGTLDALGRTVGVPRALLGDDTGDEALDDASDEAVPSPVVEVDGVTLG